MRGARGLVPVLLALVAVTGTNLFSQAAPSFVGGPMPKAPDLTKPRNHDIEPSLAIDGGGTIWAASNVTPYAYDTGFVNGVDVWKSTDGGLTYKWVANPVRPLPNPILGAFGGNDADIAAAPVKNANGYYNIYVASLWLNNSLSVSRNGGRTWVTIPIEAAADGTVIIPDRPWVAADGPCTVYLAYNDDPAPNQKIVQRYNACLPVPVPTGVGFPYTSVSPSLDLELWSAFFGKMIVDASPVSPYRHSVYMPSVTCPTISCNEQFVGLAISRDGGLTWKTRRVAAVPVDAPYSIWPVSAATDRRGNIYVAWHDRQDSFISVSHNGGTSWSPKRQLNTSPSLTAVYPTVAAGGSGVVEVAWYGTTVDGDANDPNVMKLPGEPGAAQWKVYRARSTDAGVSFTQAEVSPVVHTGIVCTDGAACMIPNSRNLFDCFGAVLNRSLRGVFLYTSDQPGGNLSEAFSAFATEVTT